MSSSASATRTVIDLLDDSDDDTGTSNKRDADPQEEDGERVSKRRRLTTKILPYMASCEQATTITEGRELLTLLEILEFPQTFTCNSGSSGSTMMHIQQQDKWSCGFRNVQMMLSALLPKLSLQHHPYFAYGNLPPELVGTQETRPIPSLRHLQLFLEDAWRQGFDEKGARHYSNKSAGQTDWIGAVEASTILLSKRIDSVVIQFMKVRESRSMLAPFVWNYFSLTRNCSQCGSSPQVSCAEYATRLLQENTTTTNNTCSCPVLPLYLQWEGHSVSIVGIQKKSANDYDLILFDPNKNGQKLKESLMRALELPGSPLPMFVPAKTLLNRDCQIRMSSERILPEVERSSFIGGNRSNVVTAAEAAVRRSLSNSDGSGAE